MSRYKLEERVTEAVLKGLDESFDLGAKYASDDIDALLEDNRKLRDEIRHYRKVIDKALGSEFLSVGIEEILVEGIEKILWKKVGAKKSEQEQTRKTIVID